MAISKILYIKDSGASFHGKSLKDAIDYIKDKEKTQQGRLIKGINCNPEKAFEQMKETKKQFGKLDKRQGYHLILSFKEGEVDADTAMEITDKFVKSYLGKEYEAIYAVHDNTECIHSHIIFNSVSFLTGKKYRYEKGDWAKEIQPLMNSLCREYGLSELDFENGKEKRSLEFPKSQNEKHNKPVWNDMIKRDMDACILQAASFESFVNLLMDKGYEVKNSQEEQSGKYLAICPPGMSRFRRCKSLGEQYTEEEIRRRIEQETLSTYQRQKETVPPQIVYCKVRRYRRAKLSGVQKKYFAKFYRLKQLKKRPYSQAWKYRADINKMHQLQKQYLFLANHDIQSLLELQTTLKELEVAKSHIQSEKSQIYKERRKFESLFQVIYKMNELVECENSFVKGDVFFQEEHEQWTKLEEQLSKQGYSYEEVKNLINYYSEKSSHISSIEKIVAKELRIAKSILVEAQANDQVVLENRDKNKNISEQKAEKQRR